MDFSFLAKRYYRELTENVIPFWLRHSMDEAHGGYFSCLLSDGEVYDTDKFVWLQARQVWTFSMLYNQLECNPNWLDFALHGARFLEAHGRDEKGDWYFSLTRDGRPLLQPYNIFSDCFAAMAFGQLARATGSEKQREIAAVTFQRITERRGNPKGIYEKAVPGTRPLKSFALPMILCNLVLEIEDALPGELVEETIEECIREISGDFYDPGKGLLFEHVAPDGKFVNSFEGRLLNPGHAIEATWFIMDLAARKDDESLMEWAVQTMLNMLTYGWDEKYGGIYYFMDARGYPPQQLEWDQKLWWVHLEALVALLKGYAFTGEPECAIWFEKLHDYTWQHFPDPNHGEWFGYLNRQGEVLLHLKGGKWKGCFHVPRALFQCARALEQLIH